MIIPWLSLIIWLPTLAALLIAFLPRTWVRLIQALAVGAGAASAVLSLRVFLEGLANTEALARFQLVRALPWLESLGIQYKVGVDGLSISMMLLTGLVSLAALWMSVSIDKRQKEYFVLCLLAITGVYGVFASIDLFFFIIFYELASIPMYFLVGIWGSDKIGSGRPIYRERAATKLLLYLQLGGGLVLLGILALYFATGAKTFDLDVLLQTARLSAEHQKVIFLLFFFGFAIEAGLVPLHTWLPEGHSSAPTPLSMLLAGVLLKMGGYGILRFCLQLTPAASAAFLPAFAILGVVNILYGGLCALRQSDVKVMIAYSSVSHMGMFYLGIGCCAASAPFNGYGVLGAQFQLFSHGVITALLFAVAGAVYNKTHSRDLRAWGGLGARTPIYTFFYVMAAMGSLGLPGMTGFWAEFMVLFGTWGSKGWMLAVLAVPGLLITTMFLLRSVQYGFFGPLNPDHVHVKDADWWEVVAFLTLATASLGFGVFPHLLTNTVLPILPALIGGSL
jgi:NADH-quinone oxidoreductase subunit M